MRMMQGDQYNIPFEIKDTQGAIISPDQVTGVEIVVGALKKNFPFEVSYANGLFLFPLSQEESFAMRNNTPVQIRVKFISGDVVGTSLNGVNVFESISKEVL